MSKVEILELQHKIVDWKLRFGVAVFFALFFAVGFFFMLDANKDLSEQIDSALDLSRYYEDEYNNCSIDHEYWYNNGEGISFEELNQTKLDKDYNCLKVSLEKSSATGEGK